MVAGCFVVIALFGGCKSDEPQTTNFSGAIRIRAVDAVTGLDVDSHLHVGFVHPSGSYASIDGARGLLIHNTDQPTDTAATILTYDYEPCSIERAMFQPFDGMLVDHQNLDEITVKLTPKAKPQHEKQE